MASSPPTERAKADRRIAFAIGPESLEGADGSALRLGAMVRHAVAHGVARFDLTDARALRATLDLTRAAGGNDWAGATVFLPGTVEAERLAPSAGPARIVHFREGADSPREPIAEGGTDAVRFPTLELAEAGALRVVEEGAGWISFPAHLLDARRVEALVRELRRAGAEVLATNPFADGRLEGRWLSEGTLAHSGTPRPMDLSSLQREFAPVLPLGFLTEGRRRTLPQAAIGFLRSLDAIPSVRFRDPRQFSEWVDSPAAGPLSPPELARLATSGMPSASA